MLAEMSGSRSLRSASWIQHTLTNAPEYLHLGSLTVANSQLNRNATVDMTEVKAYLEQLRKPDGQSRHHLECLRCAGALCAAEGTQ
jgi:hypothetical protein